MAHRDIRRLARTLVGVVNPKGTQWYVISFVLAFAMNVLFTLTAASSLGAKGFGGFTLFATMTQLGVTIVNAGFYTSTMTKANIHSSPSRVKTLVKTRLATSMMLIKILAICAAAPLCLIKPSLSLYVSTGMLYILLTGIQPLWLYQVNGRHDIFNSLQVTQRVFFAIPAVFALHLGLTLPWVCLIFALSPLPTTLWFFVDNQPLRKLLHPQHWLSRRAWKATAATLHSESKFLLVDLLATMASFMPTLIIAKTSSLSQLGGYSLAERFKSYVVTVFSPLINSQYQRLCKYCLQGSYDQASILLSRFQLVVGVLALSISVLASTNLGNNLSIFASGQYQDTKQAFYIFTVFVPLLTVSAGFNLLYFSSQRLTKPQQLSSVSKVMLFALIYWQSHGPLGSITAAAIAAVASELLATLLAFLSSRHKSNLKLRLW
jgi:PST family polysaccharide transporter